MESKFVYQLKFNASVPTIKFQTRLPLIIDKDNNVVIGNSLRNNYTDLGAVVKVIVIDADEYAKTFIAELEVAIAQENSIERFYAIEKEISTYLSLMQNTNENIDLFGSEVFKEKRFVTESNFIKPPPYNFDKHTRNSKKPEGMEDSEYESLFSGVGE